MFGNEEQGWDSDWDNDERKSELVYLLLVGLARPSLWTFSPGSYLAKRASEKSFHFPSPNSTFLHHLILKISSNLLKRERRSETQFTSHFIPLMENHFLEQLLYSSNNNLLSHPVALCICSFTLIPVPSLKVALCPQNQPQPSHSKYLFSLSVSLPLSHTHTALFLSS